MHGHRPPAAASDALGTAWAGGAGGRREAELPTAGRAGLEVLGGLAGRTGGAGGLQVEHEGGLREAALVRRVGYLRHERPPGLGKRLAGLAAAVGAVAQRLVDRTTGVGLGLLDQI